MRPTGLPSKPAPHQDLFARLDRQALPPGIRGKRLVLQRQQHQGPGHLATFSQHLIHTSIGLVVDQSTDLICVQVVRQDGASSATDVRSDRGGSDLANRTTTESWTFTPTSPSDPDRHGIGSANVAGDTVLQLNNAAMSLTWIVIPVRVLAAITRNRLGPNLNLHSILRGLGMRPLGNASLNQTLRSDFRHSERNPVAKHMWIDRSEWRV